MIGVILHNRRKEFLEFACHNLIEYEEILDSSNIDSSRYEIIFTDALTDKTDESIPLFKQLQPDLAESLSDFILSPVKSISKDMSGIASSFLYFNYLTHTCTTYYSENIFDELFIELDKESKEPVPLVVEHTVVDVSRFSDVEEDISDIDISRDLSVIEPQRSQQSYQQLSPSQLDQQYFKSQNFPSLSKQSFNSQDFQSTQLLNQQSFVQQNFQSFQPVNQQQPINQPISRQQSQTIFDIAGSAGYVTPNSYISQSQMPQQPINRFMPTNTRKTSVSALVRANGFSTKKAFRIPVFVFSSLTPKAGMSSIVFLLSSILAGQQGSSRVLYLDLNMSNPNYILNLLNLNQETDASVRSLLSLTESDFIQNMSFLTETVMIDQTSFSLITLGRVQLAERMMLASLNFSGMLETIQNSFDIILVDMGQIQATLPYQMSMLTAPTVKNIVVADGSDSRLVRSFIDLARQLTCNYEIIINKNMAQSGSFMIMQQLRQQPLAVVNFHRNINRYLTGQLLFQDSALYNELSMLGGKL